MNTATSHSPTGRSQAGPFQGIRLESTSLARVSDPNRNATRARKAQEMALSGNYPIPRFVGVDGEGVTGQDGVQRYVLLGVGDRQIECEAGLSFAQIMGHLYDCFLSDREAVYAGFYLGYDFAHWLRGIPEGRARLLLIDTESRARTRSGGNRTPFPVYYDGWEFDVLANKRFKLRPSCCDTPWHKKRPTTCSPQAWMYINDCGPFFQTSLLKAIDPKSWNEPVVSDDEYAVLVAGKTSRGTAVLDDDMRRYNALENEVLARLMGRQAAGMQQMGVRLARDQWYGPGQAAAVWMGQQGVARRITRDKSLPTRRFQEIARRSYFGGWFEIFMHGKVPGASYGYDINSAYPYVMSSLGCLRHGTYSYGRGKDNPPPGGYTLVSAAVHGSNDHIGSVLHRTNASRIRRPLHSRGVYWLSELEVGRRAGLVDNWSIDRWWSYVPCDCEPPLRNLARLYEYRQRIGKNTAAGKAAKLVYNSCYGKFAQSVGRAPFGDWVYASLITSGCRTMILDAIATHPIGAAACEMVATDGVFFTSPHPNLPLSSDLGDWEETVKQDLVLFKPGFYWDAESKGKATYRSRGIRATDFSSQIPAIEGQFEAMLTDGTVPWPSAEFAVSFSITSPLVALRRNKWETAAEVHTDKRFMQSSNPDDKRIPVPIVENGVIRTLPYEGGEPSRPYDKTYADECFPADEMEELGLTEDGDPGKEWNEVLRELRGE